MKAADLIKQNQIVVFSLSYCPYCKDAKNLLLRANREFCFVQLDHLQEGQSMIQELYQLSGQTSVPNIFINGQHIQGLSQLEQVLKPSN